MSKPPKNTDRMQRIRRGQPIEELGLKFYPITMELYDEFLANKSALIMRMSAFPARLACMDYLSALFAADTDENYSNYRCGAFGRAIRFLYLSLRIKANEELLNKSIYVYNDEGKIHLSKIVVEQDGNRVEIKASDFSNKIRPLLCAQNGLELPDENINLELLKSYDEKRKLQSAEVQLNQNIDDLVATVSYMCGKSIADIWNWTVLEFEQTRRAIERERMFFIYKTAELSGNVTFKNGNPVPSLFFDALDDSLGTRSLSDVGKSFGNAQNGGELPQNTKK